MLHILSYSQRRQLQTCVKLPKISLLIVVGNFYRVQQRVAKRNAGQIWTCEAKQKLLSSIAKAGVICVNSNGRLFVESNADKISKKKKDVFSRIDSESDDEGDEVSANLSHSLGCVLMVVKCIAEPSYPGDMTLVRSTQFSHGTTSLSEHDGFTRLPGQHLSPFFFLLECSGTF